MMISMEEICGIWILVPIAYCRKSSLRWLSAINTALLRNAAAENGPSKISGAGPLESLEDI
jgi:hypothetical protein